MYCLEQVFRVYMRIIIEQILVVDEFRTSISGGLSLHEDYMKCMRIIECIVQNKYLEQILVWIEFT